MRTRAVLMFALLGVACAAIPPLPDTRADEEFWRASRDLFRETHRMYADGLLALEPTTAEGDVWGDVHLPADLRDEILARGRKGVAWAAQVVRDHPDEAQGHLYVALHLALGALGKSDTRAFLEGLPRRIRRGAEQAIALDPDGAAHDARLLLGKYYTLAPWPYRNRDAARAILERATGDAADPLGYLLLGDLHHLEGRAEEAITTWWRALESDPHPSSAHIDAQVRALALRRLQFAQP